MADELLDSIIDGIALNSEYNFTDADGLRDKYGNNYRIEGYDAAEITKVFAPNKVKAGTVGGAESTAAIQKLAREQGYTNVVKRSEGAAFGRGLVDLQNDRGESFSTALISSGAIDADQDSSQEDLNAYRVAELFGDNLVANNQNPELKKSAEFIRAAMKQGPSDKLDFKQQAMSELQYAWDKNSKTEGLSSALMFDKRDRNIMGESNNPLSDAFGLGLESLVESAYGAALMLGDVTDSEVLSELGESGTQRSKARANESAKFLSDYRDVNGFGDAMEYVGTNMAMSLPYMGAIIAGTALGPAGLTGVASLYSGQIYSDQPEDQKNAVYAIAGGVAQTALDKLGLDLVLKAGPPKQLFKEAISALTAKGMTKEAAELAFSQATRKEMAGFTLDAAKIAKDQVSKRAVFVDTLGAIGGSGLGESVTEALQETIGYMASHPGGNINWDELQHQAISAAIAGGALGGTFGGAGAVHDKAMWRDAAWKLDNADPEVQSQASKLHEDEVAYYEREGRQMPDVNELTRKAGRAADNLNAQPDFNTAGDVTVDEYSEIQDKGLSAFEDIEKKDKSQRTWQQKSLDALSLIPKAFPGHLSTTFSSAAQVKYRAVRELAGMFGSGNSKVFSGDTYANFKHHTVTRYKTFLPEPKRVFKAMGVNFNNKKQKVAVSDEFYRQAKGAIDPETGKLNPALFPDGPNKAIYQRLAADMVKLGDNMYNDQLNVDPTLGYTSNYLLRFKSFDKAAIDKDRAQFVDKLMGIEGLDISRSDANAITESIVEDGNVNTLDEAFSLVKGQPIPGSHKSRTLGLSERSEFNNFMEKDVFANVANAASSAARVQAHEKYVGKDGKKVAAMLVKAIEEGMPLLEAAEMGRRIKDYLDAESGNYKRPTTEGGKKLIAIQKNFIFLTSITSLWKATVSSLPELALMTRSLEPGDISKIKSEAEGHAKSMLGTINAEASSKEAQDAAYESLKQERNSSKQALRNLGFYDWDVGAATTTGVTEVSELKQKWLKRFFQVNGLAKYTDMTRAGRVSFAGDYIFNNISTVLNNLDGVQTNEVMESKEKLRNLGMNMSPTHLSNVRELMNKDPETLTPDESSRLDNALRDATYNFVNEAIVLPTAGNRPLIYSDPRFALFTQFQGFMATFTSTAIPKLWNDMIGRGSPAMQYNAFATMASMIALGFLSQAIKDQMNFGEESPYLDENEKIRRGIESSGLLGTASRITDTLFPLYEQQSKNPGDWVWKQVEGQSPALSKATQALGLSGAAVQGEKDAGGLLAGAVKLAGIPTKGVANSWDYLTK